MGGRTFEREKHPLQQLHSKKGVGIFLRVGLFSVTVYYILCHGWEVDTGFIQPEVSGLRHDSPRAPPAGYHFLDLRPRVG